MRFSKILIFVAAIFISSVAGAAQYYVCSSGGNDSNDGLSTGAPWASLSKANTAVAGSVVSFCGGGVWNGQLTPAADSITYNVYNKLTDFTGTASVSGSTLTVHSGSGGDIGVGSKVTLPGLPTCKGGQCATYVAAVLTGSGGVGTYKINLQDDFVVPIGNVTITGKPPTIVGSGAAYALNINARNNTSINGLAFLNAAFGVAFVQTSFQGIASGSITNSVFGVTTPSSTAQPIQFVTSGYEMRGVTFSDNFMFGTSYATNSTKQGMYFYHGAQKFYNFTIARNSFYNIGGNGIQIVGSSMSDITSNNASPYGFDIDANYFVNTAGAGIIGTNSGLASTPNQSYIRNNKAYNVGLPTVDHVNGLQLQWARGVIVTGNDIRNVFTSFPDGDIYEIDWAWVDASHLSDGVVLSYNYGSGAKAGAVTSCIQVIRAINTSVYGNVCYDNSVGISHTHATTTYNNVFWNNTVHKASTACGNLDDGGYGDPSGPSVWYNNILSDCGLYTYRVANGSTPPTESYSVYFGNTKIIWNSSGGVVAAAMSNTSVIGDPMFVSPGSGNLHIKPGSAALGLGVWTGNLQQYQTDFDGYKSTKPKPDAGAFFYKP